MLMPRWVLRNKFRWDRLEFPRVRDLVVLVVAASLAAASGILAGRIFISPILLLALVGFGVLVMPVMLQLHRGTFDLFSPLSAFVLSWAVMFVLRPLSNLINGDMTLRMTYEVGDYFPHAIGLSVIGAASFLAAYFIPQRTPLFRETTAKPELRTPTLILKLVALAFALPGLLIVGYWFGTHSTASTAYVYMAPLMLVSTGLIFLALAEQGAHSNALVGGSLIAVFVLQYLIVGSRFSVLIGVGTAVVFFCTVKGRQPSLPKALGLLLVLLFGFIGPMLTWRSREARDLQVVDRLEATANSIPYSWTTFINGGSVEMLPALALQVSTEGENWAFSPGYLVQQLSGHWIPREIWSAKRVSIPELLYGQYFPEHYAVSRANTQFSILGEFYFDSGVIGVVIGMFALGLLARFAWHQFLAHQRSVYAHLMYAPFLPLFVSLLRGDTALILSFSLFIYLPLLIVKLWADNSSWRQDTVPTNFLTLSNRGPTGEESGLPIGTRVTSRAASPQISLGPRRGLAERNYEGTH